MLNWLAKKLIKSNWYINIHFNIPFLHFGYFMVEHSKYPICEPDRFGLSIREDVVIIFGKWFYEASVIHSEQEVDWKIKDIKLI